MAILLSGVCPEAGKRCILPPALVPTGGAWNDADSLAAARRDPESREAARRCLETLGR